MNKTVMILIATATFITVNCKSAKSKTEEPDSSSFTFNQEKKGEMSLRINGMNRSKGHYMIMVVPEKSNGKTKFPTGDSVAAVIVPAQKKTTYVKIQGIPFGKYAVAVIHDTNSNGKFDFIMGITPEGGKVIPMVPNWPREGYGFSNVKFGLKNVSKPGAPSFKKAAFDFNTDHQEVEIEISYFWRRWGIPTVGSMIFGPSAVGGAAAGSILLIPGL